MHAGNPRRPKRPAGRRADLEDHSEGYDAWEAPPSTPQHTHQDTQQERNEKADFHWRRTLPQKQRLASAQRHDAIRAAAKQAVLASVQADLDSGVHKAAKSQGGITRGGDYLSPGGGNNWFSQMQPGANPLQALPLEMVQVLYTACPWKKMPARPRSSTCYDITTSAHRLLVGIAAPQPWIAAGPPRWKMEPDKEAQEAVMKHKRAF